MRNLLCFMICLFSICLSALEVELSNDKTELSFRDDFGEIEIITTNINNSPKTTVKLQDCRNTGNPGEAELPVFTKLVTLPEVGNFVVRDVKYNFEVIPLEHEIITVGWQDDIPVSDSYFAHNKWLPEEIITISSPNIMRSQRFTQISIAAVQYNPALNKLRQIKDMEIQFSLDSSNPQNPLTKSKPSAAFDKIAVQNILGAKESRGSAEGQYLIIAPDNVADDLEPLVQAKQKLGYKAKLALLSETGSTENQIKNYLQNAYDNWTTPPEYVILVGDVDGPVSLPAFFVEGYLHPWCVTDHTYTLLDGDDYFPDILIGRLSVRSSYQLNTIINKIIKYQFEPYMANDWMKRAIMISYIQDNYWQFFSPRETVMAVREKLLDFEYTAVDTFIAPWNYGSTNLRNMINTGYSFVNYRGCGAPGYWAGPSGYMFEINDVNLLNNGYMLPFVTSITCGGGNFAYYGFESVFGETWLIAGTPTSPKGAIGFIGPSEHDTKTWFNNAYDMGLYQGVTQEGLYRGGEMLLRGKMELYLNYPFSHNWGNALNSDQFYFYVYNLLGDPGLPVWTDIPQTLSFDHPTEIVTSDNYIPVALNGLFAEGSDFIIAITNDDSLVARGVTDISGEVNIPISNLAAGTYSITASKYGYIPQTSSFEVIDQNIVAVTNIICQPAVAGELIDFSFIIENRTMNEETVDLEFVSQSEYIEVFNPGYMFQIPAGGTQIVAAQFAVDEIWLDAEPFEVIIDLTSSLGTHSFLLHDEVQSPLIGFSEIIVANLTQCLMQNQINNFNLELLNYGTINTGSFEVSLTSLNDNASIVTGSSQYDDIPAGHPGINQTAFQIECEEVMSGEPATIRIDVIQNETVVQEAIFSVPIGIISEESPTFCDYGYFAIECRDAGNFTAPVYDWIEIDPSYGGSGTVIQPDHSTSDGAIALVDLPFDFKYFGTTYDKVSICTNGYISMGETEIILHRNRYIPSGSGPRAMIAPFWDNLTLGNVYYKYFEDQNIFVIEWSRMRNVYNYLYETFQVILYDPLNYPTLTGDGDIKFQYKEVNNVDQNEHYATVGIENEVQTEGLLMTFANVYTPTAHLLADETAIFISTSNAPLVGSDIDLARPQSVLLQNFPNPFNPTTEIRFQVSDFRNIDSAEIAVYNLKGQKVKTLPVILNGVEGSQVNVPRPSTQLGMTQAGNREYSSVWNGTDQNNQPVSSGIYFYKLMIDGKTIDSKRCVLLK